MGRKSGLTDIEKGQIRAFHEVGLSYREIGRRLHRHHVVVSRYFADPDGYGTHKSSGRPKVLLGIQIEIRNLFNCFRS